MIGAGLNTRVGPDLPHRRGRARDPGRDRGLRSQGRAHRVQRRPHARRSPTPASRNEPPGRPAHRRGARVHGQERCSRRPMPRPSTSSIAPSAICASSAPTIVDPGAGGALFTACIRKYNPQLHNKLFTRQYPRAVSGGRQGQGAGRPPRRTTRHELRPRAGAGRAHVPRLRCGPGRRRRPLHDEHVSARARRRRASAATRIWSQKARFHHDPQFPDRKASARDRREGDRARHGRAHAATVRGPADGPAVHAGAGVSMRIVYPTSNLPPAKLGAPPEPSVNGRGGSWSFLGQQGFPAITVPAGFTTEVYDRVRDPGAPIVQPSGGGGGDANVSTEGNPHRRPDPGQTTRRRRHRRPAVLRAAAVPDRRGLRIRHPPSRAAAGFRAATPRAMN